MTTSKHAPPRAVKPPVHQSAPEGLPAWPDKPDDAPAPSVLLYGLAGPPGESGHEPIEAMANGLADELDALASLNDDEHPLATVLFYAARRARALAILVGRLPH